MTKIIIALIVLFSAESFAQVIIGDNLGTASADKKGSVLLEFAKNVSGNKNNKGLIVPYNRTLPANAVEGTILLHAGSSGTDARMKFFNNTEWVDLSGEGADVRSALAIQDGKIENSEAKVVIGDTSSVTTEGALVLESSVKAMILPVVESVDDIPDPSPGMIVYINKAGAKRLAVFNGVIWSFWEKQN